MNKNTIFGIDIKNFWISDDITKEDIEKYFDMFNKKLEIMYQFTLVYYEYLYDKRDYGNGIPMTMLEVHSLTDINDNPGITVTELSKKWKKTTSAISQIIGDFSKKNLVYRERNLKDGKINNLYVTDSGKSIVLQHKKYDNVDVVKTFKKIMKKATPEEIESFFKVLKIYKELIEKD